MAFPASLLFPQLPPPSSPLCNSCTVIFPLNSLSISSPQDSHRHSQYKHPSCACGRAWVLSVCCVCVCYACLIWTCLAWACVFLGRVPGTTGHGPSALHEGLCVTCCLPGPVPRSHPVQGHASRGPLPTRDLQGHKGQVSMRFPGEGDRGGGGGMGLTAVCVSVSGSGSWGGGVGHRLFAVLGSP